MREELQLQRNENASLAFEFSALRTILTTECTTPPVTGTDITRVARAQQIIVDIAHGRVVFGSSFLVIIITKGWALPRGPSPPKSFLPANSSERFTASLRVCRYPVLPRPHHRDLQEECASWPSTDQCSPSLTHQFELLSLSIISRRHPIGCAARSDLLAQL